MLSEYRKLINSALTDYKVARNSLQDEIQNLAQSKLHLRHVDEAQQVLQQLAQAIQQEAHKRIASVVSKCLQSIFNEPYDFQILFERKRGKTEARLVFVREGVEVDPLTAAGGGVVDVAAFALRLACLVLSQRSGRRLVVLDEPFKFLSAEHRTNARLMLETLASELDVQFVMVTHIDELQTGTIVRID